MTSAKELASDLEEEFNYFGIRVDGDSVQVYDGDGVNLFIREGGRVTEWDIEGDLGGRSVNKHMENSREVIQWLHDQF